VERQAVAPLQQQGMQLKGRHQQQQGVLLVMVQWF
jgi:hypothetical protein